MMKFLNDVLPLASIMLVLVSGCQAAPDQAAPETAPKKAIEKKIYKKVGERELFLTVEKPADWKATDRRPAIVFFHGGGWSSFKPIQFNFQSKYFAARGIVCVQPEYRLIKENETPEVCIQDAKSAMRWLRSNAAELGIDPQRIAASGGSAGGHLAAATALIEGMNDPQDDLKVSAKPQALVLFNPVSDNGPVGGYGYERVKERYREFSPAHNVTKDAPPTIVFMGTKDNLIPVATSERFEKSMKDAGVRCETVYFEGKGHAFFNADPARAKTLKDTEKFLKSLGWLD